MVTGFKGRESSEIVWKRIKKQTKQTTIFRPKKDKQFVRSCMDQSEFSVTFSLDFKPVNNVHIIIMFSS